MKRSCRGSTRGTAALLALVGALMVVPAAAQVVDTSTVTNKVLCGYYGMQMIPGDIAPWFWWIVNPNTNPPHYNVDEWPSVVEYGVQDMAVAPFTTLIGGGTPYLYSSGRPAIVDTHFRWMQEYSLDGAVLWRWVNMIAIPAWKTYSDNMASMVQSKAASYGRGWCLEYDISGATEATLLQDLQNDWNHCKTTFNIPNDGRYWKMNGKPVVGIWGLGYVDRPGTPAIAAAIGNWFQSQGCWVFVGVPWDWRILGANMKNQDPAWHTAYATFNGLTPWNFAYGTEAELLNYKNNILIGDLQACNTYGIHYFPTTYPSFSFRNTSATPCNGFYWGPRGGQLLWDQFYHWKNAGCQTQFVAQFDEWMEAMAICKVADNVPTSGCWVTSEGKGSDWYLRLTNQGTKMQKGQIAQTPAIPINHAASPDNAAVAAEDIPLYMSPGTTYPVMVSLQNTGECGWNDSPWWALGAPDSSDPFAGLRHYLPGGSRIAPGGYGVFTFNMVAPATPNTYNTNWQMVHEAYRWFGPVISKNVQVVNGLPAKAANPFPANGATNVNRVNLTVSWSAAGGATSYDLHGGAGTYPPAFLLNTGGTSYFAGTLSPHTTYYWRVNAKNTNGYQQGSIWSFTTGG